MKIEIIRREPELSNIGIPEEIHISKREFLQEYQEDEDFMWIIQKLAEMLCAPYGFSYGVTQKEVDEIYAYLCKTPSAIEVVMCIEEVAEFGHLTLSFVTLERKKPGKGSEMPCGEML